MSISFDPEHDTPKVLRDYGFSVAHTHDPALFTRWEFAAPSAADLPKIADFFALTVKPEGGLITHNLSTAVIGPDGEIIKWYHGSDWQVSDLINDVATASMQKGILNSAWPARLAAAYFRGLFFEVARFVEERRFSAATKTIKLQGAFSPRGNPMKYILIILALLGVIVSSLALREHYRDLWRFALQHQRALGLRRRQSQPLRHDGAGIPVAALGIAGYILMGALAFLRSYRLLLVPTFAGLAFSLYLANIEANVLGVWCIYCVISLGIISLMSLLTLGTVVAQFVRKPSPA